MTTLLLHGLGSSSAGIRSYLHAAPVGQVVAPDVRAHGQRRLLGDADDFDIEQLARECGDALAHVWDGTPVTIVGVSMGAAIGLRIALSGRFPIDRVAFMRPSFGSVSMADNLTVFPVIGAILEQHDAKHALGELRQAGVYGRIAGVSPAAAAAIETQVTQPLARERRIRLLEIPRNRAYRSPDELRPLGAAVPTVVLASPRDPVHPLDVAEEWRAGLACRMLVSPARDDGQAAVTAWYRDQLASFLTPYR